jgi:hypothetical protein
MRFTKVIITYICALFLAAGFLHAGEWRGITPLHSTRADVERLLGRPAKSSGVAFTYDTRGERVRVFYSAGLCKEGSPQGYNVPQGTVLSFIVYPNTKLLVSDLKLDMSKYKREHDPHVDGIVYYFNREEGVRLEARTLAEGGEDVESITYEPAAADNHLRCDSTSAVVHGNSVIVPPHKKARTIKNNKGLRPSHLRRKRC